MLNRNLIIILQVLISITELSSTVAADESFAFLSPTHNPMQKSPYSVCPRMVHHPYLKILISIKFILLLERFNPFICLKFPVTSEESNYFNLGIVHIEICFWKSVGPEKEGSHASRLPYWSGDLVPQISEQCPYQSGTALNLS